MSRSPFDLTFDELVAAGASATASAIEQAERAGVPIAAMDDPKSTEPPSGGWTAEREAELRRLWAEGVSASEIARRLGGLTRNRVIGKVHRLGLEANAEVVIDPAIESDVSAGNPSATGVVLTLGPHMCKWPIGDPSSDGFTFCGRRTSDDSPYCVQHARVAYGVRQTNAKARSAEIVTIQPRRRPSA